MAARSGEIRTACTCCVCCALMPGNRPRFPQLLRTPWPSPTPLLPPPRRSLSSSSYVRRSPTVSQSFTFGVARLVERSVHACLVRLVLRTGSVRSFLQLFRTYTAVGRFYQHGRRRRIISHAIVIENKKILSGLRRREPVLLRATRTARQYRLRLYSVF